MLKLELRYVHVPGLRKTDFNMSHLAMIWKRGLTLALI